MSINQYRKKFRFRLISLRSLKVNLNGPNPKMNPGSKAVGVVRVKGGVMEVGEGGGRGYCDISHQ